MSRRFSCPVIHTQQPRPRLLTITSWYALMLVDADARIEENVKLLHKRCKCLCSCYEVFTLKDSVSVCEDEGC